MTFSDAAILLAKYSIDIIAGDLNYDFLKMSEKFFRYFCRPCPDGK